MNQCHICGKSETDTDTEKCKLCCDGIEHEFCQECAGLYRTFKKNIRAHARAAATATLETLQAARDEWIKRVKDGAA